MSGIGPSGFQSSVQKQKRLWKNSREAADEVGDDVYSRTTTPVIVTDEVVGSHAFDEAKGENERRTDAGRPERVRQVAELNRITGESQSGESFESQAGAWDGVAERGSGSYLGLHPVMQRKGVYVYGCPHLIVFQAEKPLRVFRLRGTKYMKRDEPFANQLIGPWLTSRILGRGGFDVSDLSFTLLRYDRTDHPDLDRLRILTQIRSAYAEAEPGGLDVQSAVRGLPNLRANTYDYDPRFRHDSCHFHQRLRRSLRIIRGEIDPAAPAE